MAAGFRTNQRTQSGRTVKINVKMRALMADSVWKVAVELSEATDSCGDELDRALREKKPVAVIKALRQSWLGVFDDMQEAIDEYRQLATPEEYADRHDRIEKCIKRHLAFDDSVVLGLESFATKQKIVRHSVFDKESSRLQSELKKVEEQISRVSKVSAKSAPGFVTWSPPATGDPPPTTASDRADGFDPKRHSSPYPDAPTRQLASAQSNADPTTAVLEKLAGLLSNKREHLPKLEPEIFSGDILSFPPWVSSFESLVEQHADNEREKLFYLGKYTAGEAKEAIVGFLTLHSDDAFHRAKSLLQARYGDKVLLSQAYRRKLFSWPAIKKDDGPALRKYADFLWQCNTAMESVLHLDSLNTAEENAKIVKVLPKYIVDKWTREIDRWYYHRDPVEDDSNEYREQHDSSDSFPPFLNLCRLVSREARIQNGPISHLLDAKETTTKSSPGRQQSSSRFEKKSRSFASSAAGVEKSEAAPSMNAPRPRADGGTKPPPKCFLCAEEHFLSQCPQFAKKPAGERKAYAEENRLCFGCLGKGHAYRTCRIKIAGLFTDEPPPVKKKTVCATQGKTDEKTNRETTYFSMIVPVVVSHVSSPGRSITVNALLDTQSDSTFLAEELLDDLGADSRPVDLDLVTMGARHNVPSRVVNNLMVKGLFESEGLIVRECFTRNIIPANEDQLPDPKVAARWPHLCDLEEVLLPRSEALPIGMLIGHDCPGALLSVEQRYIGDDCPVGIRTRLGWSFMGPRHEPAPAVRSCFSTSAKVVSVKEVARAFDNEYAELRPSDEKVSQEDLKFVKLAEDSIKMRDDGHMEMDLPFRCEPVIMPDNYDVAEHRLKSLGRKMRRNDEFADQYRRFMSKLIDDGHAELATTEKVGGKYQYMPHHGVSHPRKPGEIRGVFDGSSETNGVSLNQMLLSGPDLTNNLLGVLCNFRKEKIAFMCDVRGMFLQVFVSEHQRDYLRFLWFRDGNPEAEILEYRMKVHVFGATSSPSCVNYALKRLAQLKSDEYDSEVVDFIRRHFYVDDGLKSEATVAEVVKLFLDSHALCRTGGFELHKFTSNSTEAIEQVPEELRAKSVKEFDLNPSSGGIESSLGMTWNRLKDCFLFIVKEFNKKCTRRGMLSALSGVYDPMGFISPIVLVGRQLLQELCIKGADWDDPLEPEYVERWHCWYRQLFDLRDMEIPRCLRSSCDREGQRAEFHHFSDASCRGLGACSYLRLSDASGHVDVTLLIGKAKVPPKKMVTIPRMELQAALLTARQASFLRRELSYEDASHWFWTDSKVVLGYLKNTSKRFHLFVSNRVQQIHELTDRSHWRHVSTHENPADVASRGCSVAELREDDQWWHGPAFLRSTPGEESGELYPVPDNDPEVKQTPRLVLRTTTEPTWLMRFCSTTSSLSKLLKYVAVYQRYIQHLRDRVDGVPERQQRERCERAISVSDIAAGRARLVRLVQAETLMREVITVEKLGAIADARDHQQARKMTMKKNSSLHRLDAFLDDRHVMRVGGRMRRAYLSVDEAHPAIVPKSHPFTYLAIAHAHDKVHHTGRQATLAAVRAMGLWVIHGRAAVDSVINKCVTCRRIKSSPMVQKMADLPPFRVQESAPFTYCGADLFGPITIKEGRSYKKRWICLFTCFSSRAVQLEPVNSLTTASFINALRRLMNRRGAVRLVQCDNGTNFVGAANELRALVEQFDNDKIRAELRKEQCDWVEFKFIPPAASHMGGLWERMVRSSKFVFYQLLQKHGDQLNDELLNTLATEVEWSLNSRPIACVNPRDPWGEPPLTPARLLTMKSGIAPDPPGKYVDADIYSVHMWRRVQLLAQKFWQQWRSEFLPDLQMRRKWNDEHYNLKKGDVVVLVDSAVRRNQWPLAIVEEVIPSADLLVRRVIIRTQTSVLERPLSKLIYLCSSDE